MKNRTEFSKQLEQLINIHSMENGSNTPDFLLAEYLLGCLDNFERTTGSRDRWHGSTPRFGDSQVVPSSKGSEGD